MKAYLYKAELLCEDCAAIQLDRLRTSSIKDNGDSDTFPQGPYPDGGGEADTPCHCGACEIFLENPLTLDGLQWLQTKANRYEVAFDMTWEEIADSAELDGSNIFASWIQYYLAP